MYVSGLNCETEINDCDPDPCMNDGECIDLVVGYRCDCKLPYSGPNCTTQLTPCRHNRCRNGAQCLPDEHYTDYTCRCPPGFTGQLLGPTSSYLRSMLNDNSDYIGHEHFRSMHAQAFVLIVLHTICNFLLTYLLKCGFSE